MTRARRQLVISSVQPHVAAEASWWRRLEAHCEPVPAPLAMREAGAAPVATAGFTLPVAPVRQTPKPAARLPVGAPATPETLFGEAVHRLLELHVPGAPSWPPRQLQRVARDFGLDAGRLRDAAAMASRILAGEGAWAWQAGAIEWHGNEVELFHRGELLRLDRLVRRVARGGAAEWWVLDFKSAWQPQRDPELVAKMQRYREAVAAAYPGEAVKAAFLTGQGKLVELA
jgi:ATP-dependent helicase/nuclease subunit A